MADDLDGLCCPLTLEAFVDPVILAGDGHTYERSAVTQWLGTGKLTSPTTGAPLGAGGTALIENHALRKTIAEMNGGAAPPPRPTAPPAAAPPRPPPQRRQRRRRARPPRAAPAAAAPPPPPADPPRASKPLQAAPGDKAADLSTFGDKGTSFGLGPRFETKNTGATITESGAAFSDRGQAFTNKAEKPEKEKRGSFFGSVFGRSKKKDDRAGRGTALEPVEAAEDAPRADLLREACDVLVVGGALKGGGSLAADGAFGAAPGCLITCGLSRSAACWEWRETRVEVAKEKKHWYSKKKGPDVEVERRWAQTGRLGGARDWVTALAADDAGAFVVGGCRGGDLLAWRPPKEATAGARRGPVTATALLDDRTALVADAGGFAVVYDLRSISVVATLLEPGTYTSAELDKKARWEGEAKGACPVLGAAHCAHAGWVSLLREDGLLATFDATTWKRVADADAGAALPSIKPACLAVTRLPRSRF
ncbi:hypothetical protein JL720_10955 [Aureococcus anophagefferens]|nr:hypothetical protein JL720_10955 [Aureococcus anophagefferens]